MSARAGHFRQLLLLPLLAGCASLPKPYSADCATSQKPEITVSPDGKQARTTLTVLTYNIEGLPWPARKNRAPSLKQIERALADIRASGTAPDVVLFQEMFSQAAIDAVIGSTYPSLAVGPSRTQSRKLEPAGKTKGRRNLFKGEAGIHLMSGGLAIASEYPIVFHASEPFSKYACAGIDCLSNKGVLFARIALPGLPDPVELLTSHMNSQRASKVSVERQNSAHALQTLELRAFASSVSDLRNPFIAGGDFNMRGSDIRFDFSRPDDGTILVHEYCLEHDATCDVQISWDGDEPWMDTQDLQYFADGERISVRPVRVEAMFDGRPGSPALSDHDGFLVVYELTWPTEKTGEPHQCWPNVRP